MKTAIESFKEAAERYCNWASAGKSNDDPSIALELLTDLYSKARGLDEGVEATVDAEPAQFKDDVSPISRRFENLIPFNPSDIETDPVVLQDDLTDTYKDLQLGLTLYRAGKIDEAIWEWRFSFHSHWGRHALSAMKMLHDFLY